MIAAPSLAKLSIFQLYKQARNDRIIGIEHVRVLVYSTCKDMAIFRSSSALQEVYVDAMSSLSGLLCPSMRRQLRKAMEIKQRIDLISMPRNLSDRQRGIPLGICIQLRPSRSIRRRSPITVDLLLSRHFATSPA